MASEDKQRPRSQRHLIAIAAGVIALTACTFAFWLLVLRTPMVPAFTDLKANDAAIIVEELKRHKVSYAIEDQGSSILVPQDQVDATRIAILGGDLPLKGTVGFELFSKTDMGLTEFAQKINYQRALQGELARTLMSMSTVETARVHITLPETGVFQDERRPAKASVTITPKLAAMVDGRAVIGIQRLVASAVEGLDAANVVVLDGAGKQLSAEPIFGMLDGAGSVANDGIEQAFAAKVRSVITQLVTDPGMRVSVVMPAKRPDTSFANPAHPVRVSLTLSVSPPVGLQLGATPLLKTAIGFDPALGDTFEILRLPPASPFQVGAPVSSAVGAPDPRTLPKGTGMPLSGIGWIVAGALAIAAAGVFFRLARQRSPAEYAAKLSLLLDRGQEHSRG